MKSDPRQLSFANCRIAKRALHRLRPESLCEKSQLLKEALVVQHNDVAQHDLVQEPIVGDSGHLLMQVIETSANEHYQPQ